MPACHSDGIECGTRARAVEIQWRRVFVLDFLLRCAVSLYVCGSGFVFVRQDFHTVITMIRE